MFNLSVVTYRVRFLGRDQGYQNALGFQDQMVYPVSFVNPIEKRLPDKNGPRSARPLCHIREWAHQDSNLEPTGYEPAALTVEL